MSLREELIQVAAVAVAIVQDLDNGTTDTYRYPDAYIGITDDILDERDRQERKWGPQHHTPAEWLAILTEEVGEAARAIEGADREPALSPWDMMRWELLNAESSARDFLKDRFGS